MADAQTRQRAYRGRQRHGRVLVAVEVGPHEIEALRRLELLPREALSKALLVGAVQRFLACAPAVAAIPAKLYGR